MKGGNRHKGYHYRPNGIGGAVGAKDGGHQNGQYPGQVHEKGGCRGHCLLMHGQPRWVTWFHLPVLFITRASCLSPKPNIWISLIPYTLSSTRDFISRARSLSALHAHPYSSYHFMASRQTGTLIITYTGGGKTRRKQTLIDVQRQPKGRARKDDYREHSPMVWAKILDCLNVRQPHSGYPPSSCPSDRQEPVCVWS